ncbi:MAG: EAL domain-containing protein [Novosphingobium sp.]|nr:EAL domain-containing protein [Novosphingobium sp.]
MRHGFFNSLRGRLTAQYTGLFAAAMLGLAVALYLAIEGIAATTVTAELRTSGATYDRLWLQRSHQLQDAAGLLAHDYGFLEAVATGDRATAASALDNLRGRLELKSAFILDANGHAVVGNDLPTADQARRLWQSFDDGRLIGVASIAGRQRQVVAAPIMAPQQLGWIVFSVDLDRRQMEALEALSPVPISANVVVRRGAGWEGVAGQIGDFKAGALDSGAAANAGRAALLEIDGQPSFYALRPLPTLGDGDKAALLLVYPKAQAMAAYRPIELALAAFALLGLGVLVYASWRTSARIVEPLSRLDIAAEKLGHGERIEVTVEGDDELARLAKRFNAMAEEIAEREARISHLAYFDVLTSLPNRVGFRDRAAEFLAQGPAPGGRFALFCLDLDDFKGINDTLGHGAGDALLAAVAARITRNAGGGFVARLGSDDFVVLKAFPGVCGEVETFARHLIEAIRRPLQIEGQHIVPGASIGIAVSPDDGEDIDTLLRHADLALYRAKATGRSSVCFFEESFNERAQERRRIEADLRQAIEHGEFELYYQPLFDLATNRIGAFEALLRWNHPERGLVSPAEFVGIAEDTALILPIGAWAMREACREAVKWPPHIRVAVNVSSVQFQRDGLNKVALQALAGSGLDPSRLEIEITESIFLESNERTAGILHGLRSLGVRIALDDFGTGYSSLSYLQSFPFDKIKIDRSFINDLLVRQGATAVVRAITDLAAALGMETTAEGVEDSAQLERLREQGCTSVQGFLFSRPVRARDIPALIAASFDGATGQRRVA